MSDPATCPDATAEAPTRWLDADERAAWLSLSSVIATLPGALDAQLQRDAGLSFFEYMVLAMLAEQPDRVVRMSQLAIITNGSLSRLSHVVKRLENQGLVQRRSCPLDGRYTNAILTDAGHAKVVAAAPGHVATARALVIDALTKTQLAELRSIGDRIARRIDPNRGCPLPG